MSLLSLTSAGVPRKRKQTRKRGRAGRQVSSTASDASPAASSVVGVKSR
jgi:hypothetical protein